MVKFRFIFVLLCLCSGCYPYRQLSMPGVTGSVVDSQTGLPIAGAQVTLSGSLVALPQHPSRDPAWYIEQGRKYPEHTTGTVSAADGGFAISPVQNWDLWELHFSRWGTFYALSVVMATKLTRTYSGIPSRTFRRLRLPTILARFGWRE
jgi:hypothetical protein